MKPESSLLPEYRPSFLAYGIALTILILAADYVTGPIIQFPILYLVPVALASWYGGQRLGIVLAFTMPLVRVSFTLLWHEPWTMTYTIINAAIRIVVLLAFALLVDRVAAQTRALAHQVHVLRGMLPICAFCKRIRDESGHWQPLERYIGQRSEAEFSHTFCPECMQEHYGELLDEENPEENTEEHK